MVGSFFSSSTKERVTSHGTHPSSTCRTRRSRLTPPSTTATCKPDQTPHPSIHKSQTYTVYVRALHKTHTKPLHGCSSYLLRRQPQLPRELSQEMHRLVARLEELVQVAVDSVVRQSRHVVAQHPRGERNLREKVNLHAGNSKPPTRTISTLDGGGGGGMDEVSKATWPSTVHTTITVCSVGLRSFCFGFWFRGVRPRIG